MILGGAFRKAKYEIRRRRKSEGGQKLSKVSVRIFSEKSSDFVQDRQLNRAP